MSTDEPTRPNYIGKFDPAKFDKDLELTKRENRLWNYNKQVEGDRDITQRKQEAFDARDKGRQSSIREAKVMLLLAC